MAESARSPASAPFFSPDPPSQFHNLAQSRNPPFLYGAGVSAAQHEILHQILGSVLSGKDWNGKAFYSATVQYITQDVGLKDRQPTPDSHEIRQRILQANWHILTQAANQPRPWVTSRWEITKVVVVFKAHAG
jgi:hypothetical protein